MNRRKTQILCLWGCALVGALLVGCSDRSSWVVTAETDPAGWSVVSPVILEYDNRDTLRERDIHLLVRRRNDYGWDRLNLTVLTTAPDGSHHTDTLSVALGAETAVPTTDAEAVETSSHLYTDYRVVYRRRARLDRAGIYRFRLVPLAPAPPVEGIIGVGIEIEN